MASVRTTLTVERLVFGFSGPPIIRDVSFSIGPGEAVGLIGGNGAGKTTLLNLVSGFLRPRSGRIVIGDPGTEYRRPDEVARSGVGRAFQDLRLCGLLTPVDHFLLAYRSIKGADLLSALLRRSWLTEERERRESSLATLATLGVPNQVATRPVRDLPFGMQRLVSVAAVLADSPRVVLLDEPTSGLSEHESGLIADRIDRARIEGAAILFVEHDLRTIRRLATRVIVLDGGRIAADGSVREVEASDSFRRAILGGETDAGP